jgi:Icc-related predicted phosphoesterase
VGYDIFYLNDNGISLKGIKFWGSPIQPAYNNWAFNRQRGEAINRHWKLISSKTDILITHGPPFGILDKTNSEENTGCQDLLKKVKEIKPKYHLFGHIHEAYGIWKDENTTFINASLLDHRYKLTNVPIYIKYP